MDPTIHGDSKAAAEKRKVLVMLLLSIVAVRGSIPSGHLWAEVMEHIPHLTDYEILVGLLEHAKWVRKSGHTITATEEGKTIGLKVAAALAAG